MELIIITPPKDIDDEIAFIKIMFEKGLDRLHLRKNNANIDIYRNYLLQIPATFHNRISVHEHLELPKEFPAVGFHCKESLWKDENKIKEVFSFSPPIISASFHSWEEIQQTPYHFNYVFISPIFNSISKPGYQSNIDITKLKSIKQQLSSNDKHIPNVYALGGVVPGKIRLLSDAGFDGVVALGAVWESDDYVVAFEALHHQIKSL